MKEIYLAGGSYYDLQEVFRRMPGIISAVAGLARSKQSDTAVEAVRVTFNPKVMDLTQVLEMYFNVADTFTPAKEPRHRSAIYYSSGEDAIQIEYYMRFFQTRGLEPLAALGNMVLNDSLPKKKERPPLQTEFARLAEFTPAPETEQNYLDKHPEEVSAVDIEALREAGLIK